MKQETQDSFPRGARLALGLLLLFALGAAWHAFLGPRLADAGVFFSCVGGGLSWLSVWAFRALRHRENEPALEHARQGRNPRDGQWAAAAGTIHPLLPAALAAPFSGQPAVAYKYWITRFENRTAGPEPLRRHSRNRHLITAYAGFAMVPAEIRTPGGSVRIRGMPVLQGRAATLKDPEAYARARAYVARTEFREGAPRGEWNVPAAPPNRETVPPPVKEDWRENPGPDLEGWSLDETVVRTGDTVCVFGQYSAADKSLHAPARVSAGRLFVLMPGDAAAAQDTLRTQRAFLQIFLAVLLALQILLAWLAR